MCYERHCFQISIFAIAVINTLFKSYNNMKPNQTIINLAKSYGFDGAEFECEWNGYKVFNPTFDDPNKIMFIGMPILILYDGKNTRIADEWEWEEYIEDFENKLPTF